MRNLFLTFKEVRFPSIICCDGIQLDLPAIRSCVVTSVTCKTLRVLLKKKKINLIILPCVRFTMRTAVQLTKVGAGHEIVTGIFWVCAVHMSSYRVEPGEVVSMETVVVLHPAEDRGADGQV